MYCTRCGQQIEEGARYCPYCGEKIYKEEYTYDQLLFIQEAFQ